MLKNWCFWTVVLEKTLESPLDCKKIQPVHPNGVQSWVFIGRTDVEAETPILWPPDVKSWLIGKDLMLGKIESEKGRGWQRMRWWDGITDMCDVNRHGFGWTQGVGDGQGGLAWCSPWGGRVRHDWVTDLNWTIKARKKKESVLSHVQLFATPRTVAYQALLSMGFSRQ